MDLKTFQTLSIRTLNLDLTRQEQISNCLLGIAGESGELIDLFKKNLYQGHDLDYNKVHEELGDIMFYITNLATALEMDMEMILENNISKLAKRYPNGFSSEDSIARVDRE